MDQKIICCAQEFLSGFSLHQHMKQKHFKSGKSIDPFFNCPVTNCTSKYKNLYYCIEHLNKKHLELLSKNLKFSSDTCENSNNYDLDMDDCSMDGDEFLQSNNQALLAIQSLPPPTQMPTFSGVQCSTLSTNDKFAILMQQLKIDTKSTQVQVNTISSTILSFLNQNDLINNYECDQLKAISNSTYLQKKKCDEFFKQQSMIIRVTEYGGEMIYIDFRRTIELVLNKKEILEAIILNRYGMFYQFNFGI